MYHHIFGFLAKSIDSSKHRGFNRNIHVLQSIGSFPGIIHVGWKDKKYFEMVQNGLVSHDKIVSYFYSQLLLIVGTKNIDFDDDDDF